MLIAERNTLSPIKILISTPLIHLELFENKCGDLFLSSVTLNPGGTVFYAIVPSLLAAFLANSITLQHLFNQSPSLFMEILQDGKKALYCCTDAEIELAFGNKTINELKIIHK